MLDQRRKHLADVVQRLYKCYVLAGRELKCKGTVHCNYLPLQLLIKLSKIIANTGHQQLLF